jgi:hypothetical protein
MGQPSRSWKQPNRSAPHRRLCAWCHADMGALWPDSQAPSFGICRDCVQRYFPDLVEPTHSEPQPPPANPARQTSCDR